MIMDLFSFKCGPIERHEKQSTSLLVISSTKSAGIVKISRARSCWFAYIIVFFNTLHAVIDYRVRQSSEKIEGKERFSDY